MQIYEKFTNLRIGPAVLFIWRRKLLERYCGMTLFKVFLWDAVLKMN